ncbi:Hpt domain-containing protein [Nannocystis sp. bb15-2]|uniref:Hpt domain-containing protein n=1 Tax=Nannocystis bainbridge TaxID=2995303 RepID=A0ABT5E5S8_9BACT|nr:Hpt domain-containing protein [Nannocystis bainbridge]
MKVGVRGHAPASAWPLLWARGFELGEPAEVLLCDAADDPRAGDPPRVVWTAGPLVARAPMAAIVRTPGLAAPPPEPEPAADASVADMLAAMRRDYAGQLPGSLAALAQVVTAAQQGTAAIADARMLAHRLRGTAATYGHPAFGQLAGDLEDRLAAGDLSPAPLGALLVAMAEPVVAALAPASQGSPLVVVGPAPADLPGPSIAAPDLTAAAQAIAAGTAHALWLSAGTHDNDYSDMSQESLSKILTTLAADPALQQIPLAIGRPGGAAASVALACLLSGAWGRLAPGFPA